jgi:hypothetical protein
MHFKEFPYSTFITWCLGSIVGSSSSRGILLFSFGLLVTKLGLLCKLFSLLKRPFNTVVELTFWQLEYGSDWGSSHSWDYLFGMLLLFLCIIYPYSLLYISLRNYFFALSVPLNITQGVRVGLPPDLDPGDNCRWTFATCLSTKILSLLLSILS